MKPAPFQVDQDQLLRFSGPGPRYTSYPTVPEWKAEFGAQQAADAFARAAQRPDEPLSIYVHLPFCERLCLYCGCTVQITKREDLVARYLDALELEIERVAARLGERRQVAQLHWGGGTPTHLSPAQIERLHGSIAKHFSFAPGAEQSIEVHPHVTSFEQIETLAGLGFDRVSMGVQDLDPHVQEVIHRDQTTEETRALIEHCRQVGIDAINVDLMYGLPAQDESTFGATLETITELGPDRLAVYAYAHVPWLKPFQTALEEHGLPEPAERARLFALAIERLSGADYEVIGLDHFAKRSDALHVALEEGSLHRNFMGYTTHPAEETLALGMSAIADLGGAFFQNENTTKSYEERIAADDLPTMRGLERTPEDELRRAAIQDVMCRMQLDLDELGARFGRDDLRTHFSDAWTDLAPLADEGFCELEPGRLRVLPQGRLYLRHMAMAFDAYLREKRGADGPRFSKTV